jgi:8-oxo-dGTP pyrophosphatase MutT (NUDIX family)
MRDRAAILIVRKGRLLLMRRRKAGDDYYALPGGKIEPGESPEQAAVREILEETSLRVTIDRPLGTLRNEGRTEHYFLAGEVRGRVRLGGPELERCCEENFYELEWVAAGDLPALTIQPQRIRAMCADVAAGRLDCGPWLD